MGANWGTTKAKSLELIYIIAMINTKKRLAFHHLHVLLQSPSSVTYQLNMWYSRTFRWTTIRIVMSHITYMYLPSTMVLQDIGGPYLDCKYIHIGYDGLRSCFLQVDPTKSIKKSRKRFVVPLPPNINIWTLTFSMRYDGMVLFTISNSFNLVDNLLP